jgi:hypothetical protein
MLLGLDQNGTWPGPDASDSSGADDAPPASRRGLTHEDSCDATWEARRPPARVGQPRGEPMGRRVEDGGGSERRPVTGRIGVARSPRAKASRLPRVSADGDRQPTGSGGKADLSRAATPVVRPPPNLGRWLCRSTVQVDPKADGETALRKGCRGPAEPTRSCHAGALFDA